MDEDGSDRQIIDLDDVLNLNLENINITDTSINDVYDVYDLRKPIDKIHNTQETIEDTKVTSSKMRKLIEKQHKKDQKKKEKKHELMKKHNDLDIFLRLNDYKKVINDKNLNDYIALYSSLLLTNDIKDTKIVIENINILITLNMEIRPLISELIKNNNIIFIRYIKSIDRNDKYTYLNTLANYYKIMAFMSTENVIKLIDLNIIDINITLKNEELPLNIILNYIIQYCDYDFKIIDYLDIKYPNVFQWKLLFNHIIFNNIINTNIINFFPQFIQNDIPFDFNKIYNLCLNFNIDNIEYNIFRDNIQTNNFKLIKLLKFISFKHLFEMPPLDLYIQLCKNYIIILNSKNNISKHFNKYIEKIVIDYYDLINENLPWGCQAYTIP